ncbi:30S ribosome-binding factor RbfA [Abyssisolibacter fermentans]|uniref:30S ribosome-binding factor RbfA n=1 Tax=Abyssisolibacter fermentans TaxID=1766203 RepID=UPI0008296EEA|nr:30S ribosome-binding factor RbfA [Abyssisolibacter fermentans]
MSSKRLGRISEEIKKIISSLIRNELKDPRIAPMTSIMEVSVTKDMRYAKVYISVYGSDKEKNDTIIALQKAAGFIRKEVGREIKLKYIPQIEFALDTSIENGIYMNQLIEKVKKQESEKNEF